MTAADDDRLLREGLAAGELSEVEGGRYFSRSYSKDTARSEERTFVATSNPADKGVYNNWVDSTEIKTKLDGLTKGAMAGKTMYVLPYLMSPPGTVLEQWAAGVELTDSRTVVLHMIRMARVGPEFVNNLADPANFVRGVHVTGDLDNLEQAHRTTSATSSRSRTSACSSTSALPTAATPCWQDRSRPAPGLLRWLGVRPLSG